MKRVALASLVLATVVVVTAAFMGRAAMAGGGGCHQPRTDSAGATVDLKDNCFLPTVLRAETGATITFESFDEQPHSVTSVGVRQAGGWGSFEELGLGASATHAFEAPGVYPYFCVLHPGMVGAIVVGDGGAGSAASISATELAANGDAAQDDSDGVDAASVGGIAGVGLLGAAAGGLLVARRRRA